MAIQNVIGDAARGATWVSIHNGGGVGWGEVINGGFGFVLDGTKAADVCSLSFLSMGVDPRPENALLGCPERYLQTCLG